MSFIHANLEVMKKVLEDESCILIDWCFKKIMKANPSKFQAICMGKKLLLILALLKSNVITMLPFKV